MCGRFSMSDPERAVREFSVLERRPFFIAPRYNIAPSQPVPVVRAIEDGPGRELDLLRWGLVPFWADDPTIGHRMILARAETLDTSRAFREAVRLRRCLVVADGFFEWQRRGKAKQPYHIRRADGALLGMAGVWERWHSPDGEVIESCAIVTRPAVPSVAHVHDRMPLLVPADLADLWLDRSVQDPTELRSVIDATPPELTAVPVSNRVNKPEHDDPECVAPVAPSGQLEMF